MRIQPQGSALPRAEARDELRFAGILDGVTDGVVVLDRRWRFRFVNAMAERILGEPRGNLLGKVVWDEFPKLAQTSFAATYRRAMAEGEQVTLEDFFAPTGAWLETRAFPTPPGLVVFFRDVTQRKSAELAEQLARQRFQSLIEATTIVVWTTGPQGDVLEDAPSWRAFTGQTWEEYRGQGYWAAIHPEDRVVAQNTWARCVRERTYFQTEYRLRRVDGGYAYALARGVPLLNPDGTVREWVATCTDITDRKRAELALQFLSEASAVLAGSLDLKRMIESLTDLAVPRFADWCSVYLRSDDGCVGMRAVSHVSPAAAEVLRDLGKPAGIAELAPFNLTRVFESGQAEVFGRLMPEHLAHLDFDRRERSRAFLGSSAVAVPLTLGARTFGALLFGVGPQRSPLENEDTRLAQELARRTAIAIDHAQMFEMIQREKQRVEEANRAKDEFLATVSHELRTPLTSMLGWTQILRSNKELPTEKRDRALEIIERNARAQTQLIEDLLDVSRIITGKLRLNVRSADPVQIIDSALDSLRPAADAKGIHLSAHFDTEVGLVNGDPDRLQQVVWNLVSNAIKFTPSQGHVTISLYRRDASVVIEVTDDGEGLEEHFVPHVFERFRQARSGATRAHGGLGLGLAIVRHLVELHGGTIHATSPGPGKGSTFCLELPVSGAMPKRPVAALREKSPKPRPLARAPSLQGLKILVVEDAPDALTMLAAVLEAAQAQVATSENATEALQKLKTFQPDLLVSDVAMPGEDGYHLISRVRSLPPEEGGRIPAVALTAYARMEDRTRALLAGFQMHLPKPVDPAELVVVLASLVQRPSALQEG